MGIMGILKEKRGHAGGGRRRGRRRAATRMV
jgi:hypothetical protein